MITRTRFFPMSKIDIDPLAGSFFFSTIPPLSNYISPCPNCTPNTSLSCLSCQGTGKSLFPLNSADICFNGNGPNGRISIGIEIKSASDLISSLSSNRLQGTQLPKMLGDYQLRYLLWYGRIRESETRINDKGQGAIEIWIEKTNPTTNKTYGYWFDSKSHYTYSALQRFLCSPSFTNYFMEKHVEDKSAAAKWIVELYEEWNKPWNSHKSMKVFDDTRKFDHNDLDDKEDNNTDAELTKQQISHITQGRYGNHSSLGLTLSIIPNKQYEQMIDLYGSIKGVGYDKARVLASTYPTITSITSISELANIEVPSQGGTRLIKIGTKLASRIYGIIYGNNHGVNQGVNHQVVNQEGTQQDNPLSPISNSNSKLHANNPTNSPKLETKPAKLPPKLSPKKFNLT